jgi:hypothetical protein
VTPALVFNSKPSLVKVGSHPHRVVSKTAPDVVESITQRF